MTSCLPTTTRASPSSNSARRPALFRNAPIFGRTQSPLTMLPSSSTELVMAKRSIPSLQLDRKIRALSMRVSFLERALKPAKKAARPPQQLNRTREQAEAVARRAAMSEYYQKSRIEFYLRNPTFLAAELAEEQKVAEYLKSRGLKPEPSSIPAQFHRGLKGYRPKPEG